MKYFLLPLALYIATSSPAFAHKPSDSYMEITASDQSWHLRWDIALRDLEYAIGLDSDQNGRLTRQEVEMQAGKISAYALARLGIMAEDLPCETVLEQFQIRRLGDENYASLYLALSCRGSDEIEISYNLFFDFDPTHRGLVNVREKNRSASHVFSGSSRKLVIDRELRGSRMHMGSFLLQGVWHIWTGFDHILFLLTLLLPAVLVRANGAWQVANKFGSVFFDTLKIVSAFTLAHSVTLTLASLQIVALPSGFVESMIAFSVIVAALNNLVPVFRGGRWAVALGFGLIHGFGFAGALQDLGLQGTQLALPLLGFNLGVELGQLLIVAGFLPLAYLIRDTETYRWGFLRAGSTAVALLAIGWLLERVFDYRLTEIF